MCKTKRCSELPEVMESGGRNTSDSQVPGSTPKSCCLSILNFLQNNKTLIIFRSVGRRLQGLEKTVHMIKAPNVVLSILLASGLSLFQVNLQSKLAPTEKLSQCVTLLLLKKKPYTLYFLRFIIVNQLFLKFKGIFPASGEKKKSYFHGKKETRFVIC